MSKRGKMKAEKLFAETQTKLEQATDKQTREKEQRVEHAASLKAQRLAKKVIEDKKEKEEKIAKASKTKAKAKTK